MPNEIKTCDVKLNSQTFNRAYKFNRKHNSLV